MISFLCRFFRTNWQYWGAIGKGYQAIRVEARETGRNRLTVRTRTGHYPGETLR